MKTKCIAYFLFVLLLSVHDLQAREIHIRRVDALQKAVDNAAEGDTIVLRKGVYRLSRTLKIDGKTDLVIRGDGACLSGGVRIPLWRMRRAKDIGTKDVRLLNLRRYHVGAIVPKGDPHLTGPSWSEFYADGVPMHLSEWPDSDYLPVDSVVTPGRGYIRPAEGDGFGVIAFREDRPLGWKHPGLAWLWGCFRFGWTSEMVPVKRIGSDKTIEAGSLTNYG
ncbi:MAG: hypothetical protein IK119_08035, partial [Bacteroidales bacterium]|nr:hypothetical protein [Bacteroidales bacterium]